MATFAASRLSDARYGQLIDTICSSGGELVSWMLMFVVATPSVRPVTEKPRPAAPTTGGVITAPGRGVEKNTV